MGADDLSWTTIAAGLLIIIVAAATALGLYFAWSTQRLVAAAEKLVPPAGKFVDVDGARVHFVEAGEGLPIVMIHGLGGSLHHMQRPLMQEFGEGYRLLAMDRPGSGYSTRPNGGTTVEEQAQFIRRFIEELGLGRVLLVGHSLGGAIALRTALDHPDHVAGLALIAPLTRHLDDIPPEFAPLAIRSPALRWLVSRTVAAPLSVRNADRVLSFVFGPQKPPEDFAVAGGAMVGLRPTHFVATSEDLLAVHDDKVDIVPRYREINVPVGIIYGDADRVLDCEVHGRGMVGKIQNLEIEIIEGVGHMVQFVETPRTIALIRRIAARAFAT